MRLKVEVGGHAVIVKSRFFVLVPPQHVLVRDQRGLVDIHHDVAVPEAAYMEPACRKQKLAKQSAFRSIA